MFLMPGKCWPCLYRVCRLPELCLGQASFARRFGSRERGNEHGSGSNRDKAQMWTQWDPISRNCLIALYCSRTVNTCHVPQCLQRNFYKRIVKQRVIIVKHFIKTDSLHRLLKVESRYTVLHSTSQCEAVNILVTVGHDGK